jgi:aromatic ring-opening dioxygenase catalytic subunit (LigB family)
MSNIGMRLEASEPDIVLLLTSEHWANFFLDHISAFCIGRAETYEGPVEPWLKLEKRKIKGDPDFSLRLLEHSYANGFEPGYSHEMRFDHGSMVPLSFLTPGMNRKVVPIMFNTLAAPRATPARCIDFGMMLRKMLDAAPERIAIVATGGLSHDPGEVNHGVIHPDFDKRFLAQMAAHDLDALRAYSDADLLAKGAGTLELLAWMCLAGIMGERGARVVAYEAVRPWATGVGMVEYAA